MSSSNNKRKITAQDRKDSARIIYTMVPCLPPPLVNYCMEFCFGPDPDRAASSSSMTSLKSSSSPRSSSEFTRRKSRSSMDRPSSLSMPFAPPLSPPSSPDDESSRFRLRGMDSGAASKYRLMTATSCGEVAFGTEPAKLLFDFDSKRVMA